MKLNLPNFKKFRKKLLWSFWKRNLLTLNVFVRKSFLKKISTFKHIILIGMNFILKLANQIFTISSRYLVNRIIFFVIIFYQIEFSRWILQNGFFQSSNSSIFLIFFPINLHLCGVLGQRQWNIRQALFTAIDNSFCTSTGMGTQASAPALNRSMFR